MGNSYFLRMMDMVAGIERVVSPKPLRKGELIHRGELAFYRVTSCKQRNADDWFAEPTYDIVLTKAWVEHEAYNAKITWPEDEFMPRSTAILTNITG